MPLAAVVTTRAIAESFAGTGVEYFNTFGGNPVCCAAGLAMLEALEGERLQENARVVGEYLMGELRRLAETHPLIGDVRGVCGQEKCFMWGAFCHATSCGFLDWIQVEDCTRNLLIPKPLMQTFHTFADRVGAFHRLGVCSRPRRAVPGIRGSKTSTAFS